VSDHFVAADTAELLRNLAALGGPKLREMPLPEARAAALAMSQQLDLPCGEECVVTDLNTPGSPAVAVRLYAPRASTSGPVIVYSHGGGWMLGDLSFCDSLCRYLSARSRYRVLSVDYRRAPEHPFPAAHDDVAAVSQWLATSPRALGAPVTGIALAGDSAGGGLAAAVALGRREGRNDPLLAVLMLYPVTDASRTSPSYQRFSEGFLLEAADMNYFVHNYVPTAELRSDWRVSPLLAPDLASMPPVTLLTCSLDVLSDEGRAFAVRLVEAGVQTTYLEARGQIHGIATMRGALASARSTIDAAIDSFIAQIQLGQSARAARDSAAAP
jgi:acetyl esterase